MRRGDKSAYLSGEIEVRCLSSEHHRALERLYMHLRSPPVRLGDTLLIFQSSKQELLGFFVPDVARPDEDLVDVILSKRLSEERLREDITAGLRCVKPEALDLLMQGLSRGRIPWRAKGFLPLNSKNATDLGGETLQQRSARL